MIRSTYLNGKCCLHNHFGSLEEASTLTKAWETSGADSYCPYLSQIKMFYGCPGEVLHPYLSWVVLWIKLLRNLWWWQKTFDSSSLWSHFHLSKLISMCLLASSGIHCHCCQALDAIGCRDSVNLKNLLWPPMFPNSLPRASWSLYSYKVWRAWGRVQPPSLWEFLLLFCKGCL